MIWIVSDNEGNVYGAFKSEANAKQYVLDMGYPWPMSVDLVDIIDGDRDEDQGR